MDSYIGIIIWACLDPANPFMSATAAPWAIGLGYATMIWGYAANSISTNLARDLGTRIVAAIFFGGEAFSVDNGYSWISILVNVPATIFATAYYEAVIRDSIVAIGRGESNFEGGQDGVHDLVRQMTKDDAVAGAMSIAGTEGGLEKGTNGHFDVERGGMRRVNNNNSAASSGDVNGVAEDVVKGRDWA